MIDKMKSFGDFGAALVKTGGAASGGGAGYLLGRSEADARALYDDFEALFPGGSDDACKLDLAELGAKPDLDQALVDWHVQAPPTLFLFLLLLILILHIFINIIFCTPNGICC